MERLQKNQEYPISILAIDMNGLKIVNDTQGHAAGDEILVQTAQVIKSAFRPDDIIARVGGDEFFVILPKTNLENAKQVIVRLKQKISEYNRSHPQKMISLSVGAASSEFGNTCLEDVLKQADQAMYYEKKENSHYQNR